MVRIHHASAARAAKLGVELVLQGEQVVAQVDGVVIASDVSGKLALVAAEAALAESGFEDFAELAADLAEVEADEAEEEADDRVASVVPARYKALYSRVGRNGQNCGDDLAAFLSGQGLEIVEDIARLNGIVPEAYAHLNRGMRRMNIGNRLRAMAKAGASLVGVPA
jgi:hypothetical protein